MPERIGRRLLHDIAQILGKEYAEVRADLCDMVVGEFTRQRSNNSPLRTVLLCESPHEEEICHKHALAGGTGKNVTAVLRRISDVCDNIPAINSEDAIGCLLQVSTQHPVLDSLGLMNVSLLPLQRTPYCLHIQQDNSYGSLLCAFEKIRQRTQTGQHGLNFQGEMMQQTSNVIIDDLKRRLRGVPSDALVIPCGNVARNFLRVAESTTRRTWSDRLRTKLQSLCHPTWWANGSTQVDLPSSLRTLLSIICTRTDQ